MRNMIIIAKRAAQLAAVVALLFTGGVNAQQLSRQSQFVQNPFLVNPAFAGTELGPLLP